MSDGDDIAPADAFISPEEGDNKPLAIAKKLMAEVETFSHLRHGEATILFLMRADDKVKNGKAVLGEMMVPRFTGATAKLGSWLLAKLCGGEPPDFVMTLDAAWWTQATLHQRTALIHHELLHADLLRGRDGEPLFTAEGMPRWGIREHDIAEFNDVVALYGAWLPDVTGFAAALREGGVL